MVGVVQVMVTSSKGLMQACFTFQNCCTQYPWPRNRPLSTHASTRDPWTITSKSGSVSCGVTAPFSWVLVCTRFCLCPPRVSVSPALWKLCDQILLTFKFKVPESFQSICQIPRLGNLLFGLEVSQQCKNFFGIIVLQFVDRPPGGCIVGLMVISFKRT